MKVLIYFLIILINLAICYGCIRAAWKAKDRPESKYERSPHRYNKYSGTGKSPVTIGASWIELGICGGVLSFLLFAWAGRVSGMTAEKGILMFFLFMIVPPVGLWIIQSVYHREYFNSYPDKFDLFCWKMKCLGASEKDFLNETEYRTVHTPDGNSFFGFDSLSKGGRKFEIKDGAEVEILAKKRNMAGCVVVEDETVCWIDMDYLAE